MRDGWIRKREFPEFLVGVGAQRFHGTLEAQGELWLTPLTSSFQDPTVVKGSTVVASWPARRQPQQVHPQGSDGVEVSFDYVVVPSTCSCIDENDELCRKMKK